MSAAAAAFRRFRARRPCIDAFGAGGFRFAGMSHVGSILATPTGDQRRRGDDARRARRPRSQRLFDELAATPGSVEFVVIGTGAKWRARRARSPRLCAQKACVSRPWRPGRLARVYNIMIGEWRRVAALLLAAP